jgi:isopentenyl-diphosphate delta-isomerase
LHERRKLEHLEICLNEDVRSALTTGLERYRLIHQALPEMRLADVDTATSFLGRPLGAPLLISAMTGGTPQAREINRRLAAAAQSLGLAMGLGSQRAALEDPALWRPTKCATSPPTSCCWPTWAQCSSITAMGRWSAGAPWRPWGPTALVLHLKPLQEALQHGGDTDFRDLVGKIARCAPR